MSPRYEGKPIDRKCMAEMGHPGYTDYVEPECGLICTLLGELTGLADIARCLGKDWGSCAWAAAGAIPPVRLLKLTRLSKVSGPGRWESVAESGWSARAAQYQEFATGARMGEAYVVYDKLGKPVRFDGFYEGVLLEAKGPGYGGFTKGGQFQDWWLNSKSGGRQLLEQARAQQRAADGAPVMWLVADAEAVEAIESLFAAEQVTGIQVVHLPSG